MKHAFTVVFVILLHTLLSGQDMVKYSLPASEWAEEYGNHRAIIQVGEPAGAVKISFLWRRHDATPERRRMVIVSAETGNEVKNIYRLIVNNERCELVFGPVDKAGLYYFYYLPYSPVTEHYFSGNYRSPEDPPDAEWVEKHRLTPQTEDFSGVTTAPVIEIQARNEFHSFYPMGVAATSGEVADYLKKYPDNYLVIAEDREFPIRMLNALPLRWITLKPGEEFRGTAQKNEYYALQLGVYASQTSLSNVKVNFSDLVKPGGSLIPSGAITCFNTHGVDIDGKPFVLNVNVPKGRIQPLWIGIDIPYRIDAGTYEGIFTVSAAGQPDVKVRITLVIEDKVLSDRGDGETWRHSRLRWLNSTRGIDNEPVKPYTPLQTANKTITMLGREVILNEYGFPSEISAWGNEILAAPIQFTLQSDNRIIGLQPKTFSFIQQENGIVSWEALAENDDIVLTSNGEIEFDGRMSYTCQVTAKNAIHLQDIRLEIPYRREMAGYMFGMGRLGGFTPKNHISRWRKDEDSFWLGGPKGGIHCELRGGSYHGPLLNLYQPNHPSSWYNGVNGGFRIDSDNSTVTASAYSGYRPLKQGDEVKFEFAFIITPVKEYTPSSQFDYRYVHTPHPDNESVAGGANVMNVHHANEYNPFINYPFVATDTLKSLVQKWHKEGWKVKIYYTVRELSNYLTEIWALRSLGFEVLADGPGGGYQWLQEHLVSNYRYQWYTHLGDGIADAAILNSGESRWYNYYLEGLAWLLTEVGIDGLYLDDFSFDRRILKRMRKIMEEIKPGECHIDVHSNTAFTLGPANQYLEIYPYIDRTWYGEGFNFDILPADFWFAEVSGVPFGVVNELLLHRSVNKGRKGMVYAMAPRADWGMWQFWKEFGISGADMIGYWEDKVPVKTDNAQVYATSYIKDDKVLLVLGNWLNETVSVNLDIDWEMLGFKKGQAAFSVPGIQNYQKSESLNPGEPVSIDAGDVKFIVISKK
jgi:hypothetical protein